MSGVRVWVMIAPRGGEGPLAYRAGMTYARDLARAGVRVMLYQGAYFHCKTIAVDSVTAEATGPDGAVVTYVASWSGWFATQGGWKRQWAVDNPAAHRRPHAGESPAPRAVLPLP